MKRVLIVSSVARQFYLFEKVNIKVLKNMGFEIHGAASDKISIIEEVKKLDIEYYNISIERFPLSIKNIKAYFEIKKLVKKYKYEFIHCHSPIGGVVARLVGKATKTKVIYTAHGFHFFKGAPLLNWLVYYPIEKFLSKYTDILITINNEDYELAKNKFYAKKVEYIPGVGIDTEKIAKIEVDKKKKREELGLKEDEIVLLSVGELSSRKNHITPIRALEKFKQYNIKYLICGIGNLEKYLKKECRKLGIEDKIIFLGYRKDIYELCKISDIYVFPSLQEGLPVALMEAMANGVPIIASNIRGNNDLIKNDENGFLLNNNIEEYIEKIEVVIKDEGKRRNFEKSSLDRIKKFDIKNVEKIMREIYNKI